jgi:hypothetical protein
LIRYTVERFLYRLSRSDQADTFVVKGAILFHLWSQVPHRPTRDVDLLGRGSPDLNRMAAAFRQICRVSVEDDGLLFDEKTLRAERIREEQEYEGIRMHLEARMGSTRLRLRVDIGFGDIITPRPRKREIPCLLDFASPKLLVCPWETVVAEKYQALVALDMANSRMKDFFDLRFLAAQSGFQGRELCKAIQATFNRRGTELPGTVPTALGPNFTGDKMKQSQWKAFLRRSRLQGSELSLERVVDDIWNFLGPPTRAITNNKSFEKTWRPGGPWRRR